MRSFSHVSKYTVGSQYSYYIYILTINIYANLLQNLRPSVVDSFGPAQHLAKPGPGAWTPAFGWQRIGSMDNPVDLHIQVVCSHCNNKLQTTHKLTSPCLSISS